MATSPTDVFPSPASPEGGATGDAPVHPFFIRAARQQDLPHLAEVLAQSFHSQDGVMGWMYPLLRLGIYEDLRNRLNAKAPHQVCLVAVPQAEMLTAQRSLRPAASRVITSLAGTVELSQRSYAFWQTQRSCYLYISNLAVQAGYRRQGVARQLLTACEQLAVEWRVPDLYLHVLENNHAARRLYYKAGYRIKRVDTGVSSWFLGQPRQLYLHKRLPTNLVP
jgi:ribosomal protein S18 acetylase RimI-like enzyme